MTSFERMIRTLAREETDRTPVFPLLHYAAARPAGFSVSEYVQSAENMAKANIAMLRACGYDAVNVGADVAIEGEACGSEIFQPPDAPAFVTRPVIAAPKDLDGLRFPDPRRDGRMPVCVEATRRIKGELGGDAFVGSWVMGPMNLASQLRGVEAIMFDVMDEPEFFERLLDYALEVSLLYADALREAGADMILAGEALCSTSFISPAVYRRFILPRHKKWVEALKKMGVTRSCIHVCGNTNPILEDLGSTGASCLDLDNPVDLAEGKRRSGCAVRGNLDTGLLLRGSEEEVYAAALKLLRHASKGGGLILGSGCDVPQGTAAMNLRAMLRASEAFGPVS